MRYSITSAQISYLQKEGQIEFEELYTEAEIQILRELTSPSRHNSGRDIEKDTPLLLSALRTPILGQIASQLFGKNQIKIGFTQRLPFYKEASSLEEASSITETIGGALIDLQTRNILFILPQTLIDFPHLEKKLLITFCTEKARYIIQQFDPLSHWLKNLGYASGDLLTNQTHPLIHKGP